MMPGSPRQAVMEVTAPQQLLPNQEISSVLMGHTPALDEPINQPIGLPIYHSINLSTCLSVYLSVYLSIYLSI